LFAIGATPRRKARRVIIEKVEETACPKDMAFAHLFPIGGTERKKTTRLPIKWWRAIYEM
jgi:hypothetical protein